MVVTISKLTGRICKKVLRQHVKKPGSTPVFRLLPASDALALQIQALDPLTIEPGTIVKLEQFVLMHIDGVLIADGTSTNPIVFTSSSDADYGGNLGGSYPWRYLYLDGSSDGSLLDHVLIRKGGRYGSSTSYDDDMLVVHSDSVISNSTIELGDSSSDEYGVYMTNGELRDSVVRDNVFSKVDFTKEDEGKRRAFTLDELKLILKDARFR